MSDYINREETIKALRLYAEQKHCNGETVLANGILKAVCFVEKEENIPTLDEKEIIRKAFERVLDKLIDRMTEYSDGEFYLKEYDTMAEAIKIVKEECGINE